MELGAHANPTSEPPSSPLVTMADPTAAGAEPENFFGVGCKKKNIREYLKNAHVYSQ